MIRVAIVIGRLSTGGAEAEAVRLARGLDRERFEPTVVTLQEAGPLAADLRGVADPISLGRSRKLCPGTYRALRKLLRERKPDIVQSFLFTENVFCRLIGQGIVVSGIQGWIAEKSETAWTWRLRVERRTFPAARAVVSNSRFYRDHYASLGLDAERIEVIPSGVQNQDGRIPKGAPEEIRKETGVKEGQVLITSVSRLVEGKGHDDLLRAGYGFPMVIVGDGPYRASLEGRGAILPGERRDVASFLAAGDIFVLPSRLPEGCSNSVLEAMAVGRPVIATRTGGTPEIIEDGETGLLVPPGDPVALRAAIMRLAGDAELRKRLGSAGRERVLRDFTVEKMVKSYEALYLRLTTTDTPV